jgi:WD40 repeat protein
MSGVRYKCVLATTIFLFIAIFICFGFSSAHAKLLSNMGKKTVMVLCINKKGADDYIEYTENIIKEQFKNAGFKIMNPEMYEKVKKDRTLFEAIRNADAEAMAKIGTEFGADTLVHAVISVESMEKFVGSWEGLSSLSLKVIDTKTAEEIESLYSDPMGSVENPSAMADSSLSAKQMAIRQAVDNIFLKMGVSTESLSYLTSIAPKFYTAFTTGKGVIRHIVFSRDGKLLAAAVDDTIVIWSVAEKKILNTLSGPRGKINKLVIDKSGTVLAGVAGDGRLYTWRWPNGDLIRAVDAHAKGAWSVDISPDSTTIATGGGDGTARIWEMSTFMKIGELRGHTAKIHSLFFDPKGKYVITASDDLTIRQWDINTKKEIRAFSDPMDRLSTAALNGDGSLIVYSAKTVEIDLLRNRRTDKRYIRLRDMVSGQDIFTFEGHLKDITSVAFFPGKRYVVSAAEDRTVKIWDAQKRGEVASLEQEDVASSVAASPEGTWLGIGNNSGKIIVWKMK